MVEEIENIKKHSYFLCHEHSNIEDCSESYSFYMKHYPIVIDIGYTKKRCTYLRVFKNLKYPESFYKEDISTTLLKLDFFDEKWREIPFESLLSLVPKECSAPFLYFIDIIEY